jgi:hypothetical protein
MKIGKIELQISQRFLALLGLGWGVFSIFALKRGFQHIERLRISYYLLIPLFLILSMVMHHWEDIRSEIAHSRRRKLIRTIVVSGSQTMAQYVLMFCLPFFWMGGGRWLYLVPTALLLVVTLWDPWWNRCLKSPLFRSVLQVWTLLCGLGFLFPFLWPNRFEYFYQAMAGITTIALIPTKLTLPKIKLATGLWAVFMVLLLLLPVSLRFPILSVWLDKPRFAFDINRQDVTPMAMEEISKTELETYLKNGHALCCVAPIVAPPGVREKVKQEWSTTQRVLESPLLKTTIRGSSEERSFYSYFCKHNFPSFAEKETIRCRLYLNDSEIHLGDISLKLTMPAVP